MSSKPKTFTCFAPFDGSSSHGSDPGKCLMVAPFSGEAIWMGYRNDPAKKYLGFHLSYHEVVERCRANVRHEDYVSFPFFNVGIDRALSVQSIHPDGSLRKRVCCASCRVKRGLCEPLFIEYIQIDIPSTKKSTNVYLLAFTFHLRNEEMIALVDHWSRGIYYFQRSDGWLSKTMAIDSNHNCFTSSQPISRISSGSNDGEPPLSAQSRSFLRNPSSSRFASQAKLGTSRVETIHPPAPRTAGTLGTSRTGRETRKSIVIELSDDESEPEPSSAIKTEPREQRDPVPTLDVSRYTPDPLVDEYGRITMQIFHQYSMRIFEVPHVKELIEKMDLAVKQGDREDLFRAYGILKAVLLSAR